MVRRGPVHQSLVWSALGLVTLYLCGCSPGDSGSLSPAAPQALALPAPDSSRLHASNDSSDYRISPQDSLEVSVFQAPSLNRTVVVDGTGVITLPLIGSVRAGGRTVRELENDVTGRLGAKYLQSPQVTVAIRDAVGQKVTVDGSVKTPGVLQIKGKLTLLQAIAQAGGVSDTGDAAAVMVFRVANEERVGARFDLASIRSGQMKDPPLYGGDMVIVDDSAARTAWKGVKEILPLAAFATVF